MGCHDSPSKHNQVIISATFCATKTKNFDFILTLGLYNTCMNIEVVPLYTLSFDIFIMNVVSYLTIVKQRFAIKYSKLLSYFVIL